MLPKQLKSGLLQFFKKTVNPCAGVWLKKWWKSVAVNGIKSKQNS